LDDEDGEEDPMSREGQLCLSLLDVCRARFFFKKNSSLLFCFCFAYELDHPRDGAV
jgi:hypothetical protein